ncbi:MAG: hypothetical protein S0880_03235 [Actinomycetota bacterium]|nr:hypothetical protein [Actinomycetota bacterium]
MSVDDPRRLDPLGDEPTGRDPGDEHLAQALGGLAPPSRGADEVLRELRPRYARARARRTGVRFASFAGAVSAAVVAVAVMASGAPETGVVAAGGAPATSASSATHGDGAPVADRDPVPSATAGSGPGMETTVVMRPGSSIAEGPGTGSSTVAQPPAEGEVAPGATSAPATTAPPPGVPTVSEAPVERPSGDTNGDGGDADPVVSVPAPAVGDGLDQGREPGGGLDDDRDEAVSNGQDDDRDGESAGSGTTRWRVRVAGIELTVEMGADGTIEVVDVEADDVVVTDGPASSVRVRVDDAEVELIAGEGKPGCRRPGGDRIGGCIVTPR